jgi:hypothetical protein
VPIISPVGGASGGIGALLFDSTLGGDAASIDTGANGIAQTQNILEILIYARTDEAVVGSTVAVTFNNDAGANYDRQALIGTAAASVAQGTALNNLAPQVPGATTAANYFGTVQIIIPNYQTTSGFKCGTLVAGRVDSTAANERVEVWSFAYRATIAISRLKIANGGGTVLKAGTRLLVYGR